MNRRALLKGTGGLAAGLLLTRPAFAFAQGTSTAGEFPELTITITDDAFVIPDGLTAGRYAVTIVNNGTAASHCSLGRLPDGATKDEVTAFMSNENNDTLPDWFLHAGYVGLPDWPAPGGSLTGVIDLDAGDYFMFDPFSARSGFVTVAEGTNSAPAKPVSDATVELTEMRFILPERGLPTGAARLELQNIGAEAHEFQVLAVPEGTTADQIMALFALPENATPPPDDPLATALANYQPVAAMSILGAGRTAWLDTDLPAGTYAVMCMLPFPDGVPHAMQGMMEVVTLG